MHGEEGGHQGAGPEALTPCPSPEYGRGEKGHRSQHQEQQHGVQGVQGEVREVHGFGQAGTVRRALGGFHPLGIGHQREQGERLPLCRDLAGGEGPDDARLREAGQDVPVLVGKFAVVEAHEVVTGRLAVDGDHCQEQQPADDQQRSTTLTKHNHERHEIHEKEK